MKELITNQLLLSLQNLHEILLHVDVDRAGDIRRAKPHMAKATPKGGFQKGHRPLS